MIPVTQTRDLAESQNQGANLDLLAGASGTLVVRDSHETEAEPFMNQRWNRRSLGRHLQARIR